MEHQCPQYWITAVLCSTCLSSDVVAVCVCVCFCVHVCEKEPAGKAHAADICHSHIPKSLSQREHFLLHQLFELRFFPPVCLRSTDSYRMKLAVLICNLIA